MVPVTEKLIVSPSAEAPISVRSVVGPPSSLRLVTVRVVAAAALSGAPARQASIRAIKKPGFPVVAFLITGRPLALNGAIIRMAREVHIGSRPGEAMGYQSHICLPFTTNQFISSPNHNHRRPRNVLPAVVSVLRAVRCLDLLNARPFSSGRSPPLAANTGLRAAVMDHWY